MNQPNPSTAHEFDVICDCRTPDDEREAVTAVLQQADGMRSDREGLLATLHYAISERAWQICDAEADYEDAQEAEEMIAWLA